MAQDKDQKKFSDEARKLGKQESQAAKLSAQTSKQKAANTREINKASKELLAIENDIFDVSKNLTQEQLKRLELQRSIAKEQLAGLKQDKEALASAGKNFKEIQKAAKLAKEINKLEAKALPHRKKLIEAQTKLNKLEARYSETIKGSTKIFDEIEGKIRDIPLLGDFLADAMNLDGIKENVQKKLGDSLKGAFGKSAVDAKASSEEALKGYDSQINKLKGVEGAAGDVVGEVSDLAPVMETAGGATGGIGKALFSAIPGAGGLMAALGPILPIALAIGAAVLLIKKAFEMDQEVTDMARGMGQTKEEALGVHEHLADVAKDTDVIGANLKELTQAHTDLNKITGTNANISKDMLESQVLLTKQYGLTGDEAAQFQAASIGMGKTANQNLATVQEMVEGYNTMTGDSINFKEISKDIAKTSKATLMTYKGDIKALTLAAVQAKKMGMSLEDAANVSDKLLDIESGLEAEMKANVLTGKHMNMGLARQLALQGDVVGAAAEAVKQAGSYDEYMKLAPYQQKAIADAAGMTVDQLAKAGELQKMSEALGGEQIKDMKDLTAEQIAQLKNQGDISAEKADQLLKDQQISSNQEKMTALTDKVTAAFAKMAGPIMEILDPLFEAVDFLFPIIEASIKASFAPLTGVIHMVKGIAKLFTEDWKEGLMELGQGIIEFFYAPFKFVWDSIVGFFPELPAKAMEALTSIWNGIVSFGTDMYNAITQPFVDAWDWITGLFGGNSPSELGLRILDGISSIGGQLLDAITGPFKGAWDSISGWFGDVGSWFSDLGSSIGETFSGAIDWVGSTLDSAYSAVADAAKSADKYVSDIPVVGDVYDAAKGVVSDIGDSVSNAGSAIAGFLGFANGGTVGKGGTAVVGEEGPELVNLPGGATVASNSDSFDILGSLQSAASSIFDNATSTLGDLAGDVGEFFGMGDNGDSSSNKEMVSLLKELIAKVDQPVKVNIGGRVLDELESQASMRRSYNTKLDGAYGANG